MSRLPIDLDAETVQLDGNWFTRDDLARRIKAMLDAGDYAISKPSQALEQLTQSTANLKTATLKVPGEIAQAISQLAEKQGKTVGSVMRDALAAYVGAPQPSQSGGSTAAQTGGPSQQTGAPPPPPPAALSAGPGALRNAQVPEAVSAAEAASALPLTPKKKDDDAQAPAERSWFGR